MSAGVAEVSPKYLAETRVNLAPAGYKQTTVGLIPVDWRVANLGDFAEVRMCKRIFSGQTQNSGAIPFFKIGTFGAAPDAFIPNSLYEEYKAKYSFPKEGDILISAAGTLGKTVIYDGKPAYFQDSNIVWLEIDKKEILNEYLYHYYKVIKWASSEGSTIARLYNGIIRASVIALPPIKEQTAIANALSDVDALISELEKLIAKKQAIKTATMQQLLTGRTRLPQFALRPDGTPKGYKQTELGEIPEDWDVLPMGAIGNFGRGRVISHNEINRSISKSYPVYSSQTSNDGVMGYIDTYDFEGEFVTWTTDGVNAGKVFYRNGKFNCTNVCGAIVVKSDNAKYVSIAMGIESRKYVSTNLANPKLMNGEAKKVLIKKPCDKTEQAAIATILSDMDSEIQSLEQRLSKTRQIKQGMMQELLTGKTRLIQGGGAV